MQGFQGLRNLQNFQLKGLSAGLHGLAAGASVVQSAGERWLASREFIFLHRIRGFFGL
jgi:hypothetical protein